MKKQPKKQSKLEVGLIVPDQHIPNNDKIYWSLLMAVGKFLKPDHVVILGDFADFHAVSSHDIDPRDSVGFDYEIEQTQKYLRELKTLGASNNVYIAGNHEFRLERYLMKKSPEIFKTLARNGNDPTAELLNLENIGFEYLPYRRGKSNHHKIGKCHFTHDPGVAGKFAHYKAADIYHRNIVHGHTHAIGYAIQGDADGDRHVAVMLGWGGDASKIDYMHKASVTKNWSHGFGIFYHDTATGNVYVQPIPLVGYTCLVNGRLFTVDDCKLI
jgi:hypothetical protein